MTTQHPFVEYREVKVTDPLRQGDILEATDTNATMWRRHLLIITADCDFANAKHQGRVTCVPLLTQDEYLMEFQIPRIRERILDKVVESLRDLVERTSGRSISKERLRAWPSEQDPHAIVEALGLQGPTADDASRFLHSIQKVTQLPEELETSIRQLVQAQVDLPNGKSQANAHKEVTNTLQSHYDRPPGDALFLSAVGPGLEEGYFAYLRHLEQISDHDIAISPSRHRPSYRRVSRLQERFTHAISQQFALVFMSIGLPREYEDKRKYHATKMTEKCR